MPAFLAPIVGAAGGIALGYVLDHTIGDSDYSGKEIFVDATTGAVGGGLVGPMMRVGSRANKVIRHSGRQGYKVGAGATESLLLAGYVTKPMISRPARMELLAGTAAALVYDIAYGKSPDVRSEQNASDVTSGGIPSRKSKNMLAPTSFRDSRGETRQSCPRGYELKRVGKRMMCVKR